MEKHPRESNYHSKSKTQNLHRTYENMEQHVLRVARRKQKRGREGLDVVRVRQHLRLRSSSTISRNASPNTKTTGYSTKYHNYRRKHLFPPRLAVPKDNAANQCGPRRLP